MKPKARKQELKWWSLASGSVPVFSNPWLPAMPWLFFLLKWPHWKLPSLRNKAHALFIAVPALRPGTRGLKRTNAEMPLSQHHLHIYTHPRSKCHFPARACCSLFPYEKYLSPCQLWRASGRLSRATPGHWGPETAALPAGAQKPIW